MPSSSTDQQYPIRDTTEPTTSLPFHVAKTSALPSDLSKESKELWENALISLTSGRLLEFLKTSVLLRDEVTYRLCEGGLPEDRPDVKGKHFVSYYQKLYTHFGVRKDNIDSVRMVKDLYYAISSSRQYYRVADFLKMEYIKKELIYSSGRMPAQEVPDFTKLYVAHRATAYFLPLPLHRNSELTTDNQITSQEKQIIDQFISNELPIDPEHLQFILSTMLFLDDTTKLLIDRTPLKAAFPQLRSLDLSGSMIDAQGFKFLTPFLRTGAHLQRLDLSDNPLGGHHYAGLLRSMGMNESAIQKLADIVFVAPHHKGYKWPRRGDSNSSFYLRELRELNLLNTGADRRDADSWNLGLSLINPFVFPITVPPMEPQRYIRKIQNLFKLDSLRLNFYDNRTSPRLLTEFDKNLFPMMGITKMGQVFNPPPINDSKNLHEYFWKLASLNPNPALMNDFLIPALHNHMLGHRAHRAMAQPDLEKLQQFIKDFNLTIDFKKAYFNYAVKEIEDIAKVDDIIHMTAQLHKSISVSSDTDTDANNLYEIATALHNVMKSIGQCFKPSAAQLEIIKKKLQAKSDAIHKKLTADTVTDLTPWEQYQFKAFILNGGLDKNKLPDAFESKEQAAQHIETLHLLFAGFGGGEDPTEMPPVMEKLSNTFDELFTLLNFKLDPRSEKGSNDKFGGVFKEMAARAYNKAQVGGCGAVDDSAITKEQSHEKISALLRGVTSAVLLGVGPFCEAGSKFCESFKIAEHAGGVLKGAHKKLNVFHEAMYGWEMVREIGLTGVESYELLLADHHEDHGTSTAPIESRLLGSIKGITFFSTVDWYKNFYNTFSTSKEMNPYSDAFIVAFEERYRDQLALLCPQNRVILEKAIWNHIEVALRLGLFKPHHNDYITPKKYADYALDWLAYVPMEVPPMLELVKGYNEEPRSISVDTFLRGPGLRCGDNASPVFEYVDAVITPTDAYLTHHHTRIEKYTKKIEFKLHDHNDRAFLGARLASSQEEELLSNKKQDKKLEIHFGGKPIATVTISAAQKYKDTSAGKRPKTPHSTVAERTDTVERVDEHDRAFDLLRDENETLKKEVGEAKQEAATARQESAEAKEKAALARQEAATANTEAATANTEAATANTEAAKANDRAEISEKKCDFLIKAVGLAVRAAKTPDPDKKAALLNDAEKQIDDAKHVTSDNKTPKSPTAINRHRLLSPHNQSTGAFSSTDLPAPAMLSTTPGGT